MVYQILIYFVTDNPMFYEVKDLFLSKESAEKVARLLPKLWKHIDFSNKYVKIVERKIYEDSNEIDYNRYSLLTPRNF